MLHQLNGQVIRIKKEGNGWFGGGFLLIYYYEQLWKDFTILAANRKMDIKQKKKELTGCIACAYLLNCYKIVVEVFIISCIISTYRPYLTEAMYKFWRKFFQEIYFFYRKVARLCWTFSHQQLEDFGRALQVCFVDARNLLDMPIKSNKRCSSAKAFKRVNSVRRFDKINKGSKLFAKTKTCKMEIMRVLIFGY